MRMTRRSILAALAGSFLTGSAHAETPDLSGVTLTVGVAGPRFEASWRFSNPKTPYRVRFAAFDGSSPIVEALSGGAVDIGMAGDIGVVLAQAAGARIDIVSDMRANPSFLRLIAPKGSPYITLQDLKGKRIAVARGTSSHMFILRDLQAAGMKASEFHWVYLSNPDAGTAFQQGSVDAWATWDPFAATAEIHWGAKLIAEGTPAIGGYTFWIARPDFFRTGSPNAVAARDFIARYAAVNQAELKDRENWTRALSIALKLDPAIAKQVAEHYYFTSVPLGPDAVDAYKVTAEILQSQNMIHTIPDPAKYFDYDSVNPAVVSAIAALKQ